VLWSDLLHFHNLTTYLRWRLSAILNLQGSCCGWCVPVVICSVAFWVLHSFFRQFCLAVAITLLPSSMVGHVRSVCSAEGICCRFLQEFRAFLSLSHGILYICGPWKRFVCFYPVLHRDLTLGQLFVYVLQMNLWKLFGQAEQLKTGLLNP